MHIVCFEKLLSELKGYTEDCTISFLDMYEKVKRNAPNLRPPTEEEQIEIAKVFAKIGKEKSDAILVVNANNYIGNSTNLEIDYAKKLGKEIIYYTDMIK